MKLSPELNSALNYQLQHELRNQLIYFSIFSFFEELQLKNLAKKFKKQADEEREHFDKILQYINDRDGGKYLLPEIDQPILDIKSFETVAKLYFETESQTTQSLEEIYSLALEQRSYVDLGFITDMLNAQVVEEDEATEFANKIMMCKDIVLFDATYEG